MNSCVEMFKRNLRGNKMSNVVIKSNSSSIGVLGFCLYIFGIIIAKGFWQTVCAVVFFPYSFYLAIETIAKYFSLIWVIEFNKGY